VRTEIAVKGKMGHRLKDPGGNYPKKWRKEKKKKENCKLLGGK